jgi:hypothetical protein
MEQEEAVIVKVDFCIRLWVVHLPFLTIFCCKVNTFPSLEELPQKCILYFL